MQTNKRIIVASTALSMGVNFGDVRYIINWGPARTLLDQLQEAGRAGRDGEKSLVYHGQQLSQCEEGIKDFVKSEGCYRVAVYKTFDSSIKPVKPGYDCCSHCAQDCSCENHCAQKLPFEKQEALPEASPTMSRPVRDVDKQELEAALTEILEEKSIYSSAFGAVSSHGFSCELVEDIVVVS